MSEGILEIAAIDNALISANVFNILNWMSSLFANLHKYFVFSFIFPFDETSFVLVYDVPTYNVSVPAAQSPISPSS